MLHAIGVVGPISPAFAGIPASSGQLVRAAETTFEVELPRLNACFCRFRGLKATAAGEEFVNFSG